MTALRLAQRRARADGCDVRADDRSRRLPVAQRATTLQRRVQPRTGRHRGRGLDLDSAHAASGIALSSTPATFYYDATGAVRSTPAGPTPTSRSPSAAARS